MDLLGAINDFKNQADHTAKVGLEMIDKINKALPELMKNLSKEEQEELQKTLKNADFNSIKDNLAKADNMIKNMRT